MLRRKVTALFQAVCLLLTALSLLVGFSYFATSSPFGVGGVGSLVHHFTDNETTNAATNATSSTSKPGESSSPAQESHPILKEANTTLIQIAPSYIKAIMNPEDNSFPRLECPMPTLDRYAYLQHNSTKSTNSRDSTVLLKYFFALDLHDCAHVLPRLLGSVVETMRFLGPQNCVLSVVEGRSVDGTFEILKFLREEIEQMGAQYFLTTNEIHPWGQGVNRIEALAELRNQALQPLVDHSSQYSSETTVVFLNDVAICFEDILELIHQRLYQGAYMTCAMDWTYVGPDPTFYDVWIARGMNGDSFFDIPEDGNWNAAWNLLWNNPEARERLYAGKPFQVFSCWNGATAFTAMPILKRTIKFRSSYKDECFSGEPQLFCKDMWHGGYGKIAVVPSVNVEYGDEAAKKIKSIKGYVSRWVGTKGTNGLAQKIKWKSSPPAQVKCIAKFTNQYWVPWDEHLAEHEPPS